MILPLGLRSALLCSALWLYVVSLSYDFGFVALSSVLLLLNICRRRVWNVDDGAGVGILNGYGNGGIAGAGTDSDSDSDSDSGLIQCSVPVAGAALQVLAIVFGGRVVRIALMESRIAGRTMHHMRLAVHHVAHGIVTVSGGTWMRCINC